MGGTGILGGTFNPVHNGHLRLAVEVGEALGLDRVLLMPCASPPHKTDTDLLPFVLRVSLLEAALASVSALEVCTMEGELEGPSYTWNTLSEWHGRHDGFGRDGLPRGERPYFMMGAESFTALHTWRRGMELPRLAHLVMVPRGGEDRDVFRRAIRRYWPGSLPDDDRTDDAVYERETVALAGELAGGGHCTFLPVPRLDISSTFIRKRWLEGRRLAGLVPEAVLALLHARGDIVTECWGRKA